MHKIPKPSAPTTLNDPTNMEKKILAFYYTQSGQLKHILDQFTAPLRQAGFAVEEVKIEPEDDFPFPWTGKEFFDAMPESVTVKPAPIKPFTLKETQYDLIIFAYQPWYLSPSIPANSVLQHPDFKTIARNTPVITLIGARNMWLNAQEKVKKLLDEAGAKLVGNIALVDKNGNLPSAVTILYWMLTGKKDRFLGIFPKPGVADDDVADAKKYGDVVLEYLNSGSGAALQPKLVAAGAVDIKSNLMFIEGRAGRLFSIWANFIIKRKNRGFWLNVFKYYLIIALFIVAPFVLLINMIFFKPFVGANIKRKKEYYLGLY